MKIDTVPHFLSTVQIPGGMVMTPYFAASATDNLLHGEHSIDDELVNPTVQCQILRCQDHFFDFLVKTP